MRAEASQGHPVHSASTLTVNKVSGSFRHRQENNVKGTLERERSHETVNWIRLA